MIWISACSAPKQEEDQGEEFDQAVDQIQQQIEGIIVNIPPPSEIPFIIQSAGADYNATLVNDIGKVDQYKSEDDLSALNLGVYSTDIGYLSSYDKSQLALTYFNEMKGLADQIGVTSSIDTEMVEEFESSLGSREALGDILDDAIGDTRIHLKDAGRDRTAALVVTGTFAEGLYIVSSLIDETPKIPKGEEISADDPRSSIGAFAVPLVQLLLKQEKPTGELNALLKSLDSDATTDKLVAMTSDLVEEYASLNIEETMKDGQGMTYLEEGSLTDLINKIRALREYITG
jgi:hypothetical protein